MNFENILYFDYTSGDDITLNLNFVGQFLWYTEVHGPIIIEFARGHMNVIYRNFLLKFTRHGVTIFSDYNPITFGKVAPKSLTSFDFSEEEANTIWRGMEELLSKYPKKSLGKRSFEFDPFELRKTY